VDFFIANSKTVQKRIQKYYRRDSQIIYRRLILKNIIFPVAYLTKTWKKRIIFLVVAA
jgi:hypothetical protein